MNLAQLFTHIIAFTIGGVITVTVAYFLVKSDIQNYFRFKSQAVNKDDKSALLPLRLQAHERLIVFIERLNPVNLLVRVHQQGISLDALQSMVLTEINAEYQHNITQQLYVSPVSWSVVRKLKDDTIAMINNAAQGLPEGSSGVDLSRSVLQHMSVIEENPYELTINFLKQDIHNMF